MILSRLKVGFRFSCFPLLNQKEKNVIFVFVLESFQVNLISHWILDVYYFFCFSFKVITSIRFSKGLDENLIVQKQKQKMKTNWTTLVKQI